LLIRFYYQKLLVLSKKEFLIEQAQQLNSNRDKYTGNLEREVKHCKIPT